MIPRKAHSPTGFFSLTSQVTRKFPNSFYLWRIHCAPGKSKFFSFVNRTYPLPSLQLHGQFYPYLLDHSNLKKQTNCNFIKFSLDATFSFSYCLIFFFNLKLNFWKKKYCCYSNASHLIFFEPILHRFLLSQYSHNKNANALFVAKHISHFLVLLVCNQFFSFALLFIFT